MINKTLSPTMRKAYDYALDNGGTLTRFPGGLGQPVKWMCASYEGDFFGTSTIEGLVRRGYAVYTKWQDGKKKPFPIEATMVSKE